MVGSMRGGDSPSASGNNGGLGGPNSHNSGNSNSSSSSKGGSPSSSGNNGGLGGPTSNNSGNRGSSSSRGSSPSSSGNNGGLGGPTSNNSGNRSGSSSGGSGGNSNANGGGGSGGGLNSAGNRASGAGPGASGNTSTTGGGFGGGSSLGGMNSPRGMSDPSISGGMIDSARRADMAQSARQSENSSMSTYDAARSLSDANAQRADLAQQARTAETTSMRDLARERALGTISTAEVGVKDPYNTLSGGLIGNVTSMTVRDAVEFSKTAWKGKIANVLGAYQFKGTTLQGVAEKLGLMDAPMTPAVQDQLAVGLLQERANKATVNGEIDVNTFAKELSREWASIATTTGQSYYNANGIDKASISYAKAHDLAKDLVANGVVSPNRSVSSITSKDVSSVQTQAPGLGRFNSTYMGNKTASTPQSAGTPQQNDPSGLPAGTYRGYDPSGLPADTPAAPTAPAVTGPFPERPRSMTEKVAAGAIDVGLGMLPGIGMGVSLVNGGLALTGNKTLGEQIAGSIATGKGGGTGPDSGADRSGSSGRDQLVAKDTSTVPKKEESFESRYLAFVDPAPRPTPGQRWDYNTPGYA